MRGKRKQKNKPLQSPIFWTNFAIVKAVKQMSLKLLALSLVVSISSLGLSNVGYTMGFYLDVESSTENTFVAGSVDFSLKVSGWQATSTAVSMPPGDVTTKEVTVDPQDSNPFQYFATSTNVAGDSDFCNGLLVTANLEGVEMYNGPLVNLLTAPTTTLDSWDFTYTTGVNDFQNRVCDFDIDYNGWQTRHNYPTYENGGYNDTEKVENHLASWGFRINKVYYDVKTPERGKEGVNEWVEIFNQTNTAIDISGWEICDNTSCDTLPLTPAIPAQKYAIIVATSTTATSTTVSSGLPAFWYLPSEVTEINIDSLIGGGLANTADMLVLKRPDGVIVDQMNWGTPNVGWANYNANVWNPGAIDVAEGNVLARVPSGYDTDTPSDWTELLPPTVDLLFPDEGGSYTWYWGYSYDILWNAFNNNGNDEDLDISIFYVKDVNHDSEISEGDTTHIITETTANDGLFKWTVPSGFLGYIWIHLVATGPENPMLNTGTVSGGIWDPFKVFITEFGVDLEDVDFEAPVITVNGNNPAVVAMGSVYNDLGAMVTDNVNDNLGIAVEGADIDTSETSTSTVTYTATDQAGNVGTATRVVIVYDPEVGPPVIEEIVEEEPVAVLQSIIPEETTTEETTPTPTFTSTEETIIENDTASSTPESLIDETASSTPEIIIEESTASSTPEVIIVEDDTASSTPMSLIDETASSTPEVIIEDDTASSTPETLPDELIVEEEVVIIDESIQTSTTTEVVVIVEEPAIEPEPEPIPAVSEEVSLPEPDAVLEPTSESDAVSVPESDSTLEPEPVTI